MNTSFIKKIKLAVWLIIVLFALGAGITEAAIDGVSVLSGVAVNLTAKAGHISTPDGNSIFIWGYALNSGTMQYPGPTLITEQGATVIINLTNQLSVPVSIVFPAQEVAASNGVPGLLTREAPPGGSVQYQFTASNPGTYLYYSGTRPDLQVEMGLVGALIVRPKIGDTVLLNQAYIHPDSQFDHEYLFLLTEIDPRIHEFVESGRMNRVDTTTFFPVYWFINGRAAPDTMAPAYAPWLPTQPYNCMPMMHPNEKILLRLAGAGRDLHPFHHHGNHSRVIARDGRLLESTPGAGADLSSMQFTIAVAPGETMDSLFTWTGEKLGWDMYGHTDPTGTGKTGADCIAEGIPLQPHEYEPDHCKPFPVILPDQKDLTFGPFWSGSPFLGSLGDLPPGEGGFNPNGGFFFMWHSHAEKEITNNNIFPGGLLTMMVVEHPSVELMNP
jgi:FtsP/CotA-like multicopper oxidase with cupredoxin domain